MSLGDALYVLLPRGGAGVVWILWLRRDTISGCDRTVASRTT